MIRFLILAAAGLSIVFPGSRLAGHGAEPERKEDPSSMVSGEREIRALASAYPERIGEALLRDGDWALRIGGEWFFWTGGRLVPENERRAGGGASALRFYRYQRGEQPLRVLSPEEKERLKSRLAAASEDPPSRSEAFLSALYEAGTRAETEARLAPADLMGHGVRLHRLAADKLKEVDKDLRFLAREDAEIERFFGGIRMIGGYNWRRIAGTASRSYHSYGIALDLIPQNYDGKEFYWRNILPHDEEWFALPYEKRWMVPPRVVEAFERHGFIWGGKWLFFDTIHFEYRPEILILSDMK